MALYDESKNPAMRAFARTRADVTSGTMTLSGAINKSGILLVILVASAAFAWNAQTPGLGMLGGILGLVTAFTLMFRPNFAPIAAPIYAVFEGLVIGTISVFADMSFPGVVGNAALLTFSVLALMLFCYRLGILRATPMVTRVIVFSTMAIAVTYLVDMGLHIFGIGIPMIHEAKPIGIVFSLVVTGVAALNLILDFDLFERNAGRSPKYMEWYCGFALLVTLVWLYLEMLNLLNKMNRR